MARDRKRAKQRRDRGAAAAARSGKAAGALSSSQPVRSDVPGALDHASGEVDEFEAAIVRGGEGVASPDDADVASSDGEPDGAAEDLLQEPATGATSDGGAAVERSPQHSGAVVTSGNRIVGFLRASWAELQRVQWPDRRQVTQATAVVLGFVAIAGLYLGLADYVAKEFVEAIL